MTRTVFDNHGVAHAWAQNNRLEGRSNNSQFYFEGAALFSYGSHYLAGFILPDGVALLNADSYSPTTGKHVSFARQAVSHRVTHMVPNLTGIRDALFYLAATQGDPRAQRCPQGPETRARFKAQVRAWAVDTLGGTRGRYAQDINPEALAYILGAFDLGRSVDKVTREAQARRDAEKAEAQAAKQREAERLAHRWAAIEPAELDSKIRAILACPYGEPLGDVESMGREAFRALKWAKGRKGWIRKAEAIKARRAQVREAVRLENRRREIDARRREARTGARALRAALKVLESNGAMGGRTPWNWQRLGAAFGDMGRPFMSGGLEAERESLKGRTPPPALEGEPLERDRREKAAALGLEGVRLILEGAPLPQGTREALEALRGRLDALAREALKVRGERLDARAQAREAARLEAERETREAWQRGESVRFWGRDAQGGAYLRARGVERDESGRIKGGTLETSQGAQVPLAHALRVFRFLKWCRVTGTPWQRNGRTIRVGMYQVDSVSPDGSFRAGCHRINWPQVEALAHALGVADLAPDSTIAAARQPA